MGEEEESGEEMTQRQDVTEVVISVLICRYVQDGRPRG